MRKRLLVLLLVLLAAAGGWYWWDGQKAEEGPKGLTLYGNVDVRLVNLAFEVSGRIAELTVSEGARVTAGQRLARLETRRLELARDVAAARVRTQRAKLEELEAGTRPEEIRKLRAELEAARAEAQNARRNFARVDGLEEKQLASHQQSDDARTLAEAAEARVQALEASLALALAGPREEDIAAAKANLAALEAELGLAEENLADAYLHAPCDGVVQSRILEPGDMAATDRPVYTLALTEPLWARVYVPGPVLGKVRRGMPARIGTDSFPGKTYGGWVGYISPSAEFTPKTVQTEEVRADLVYQVRVFACDPQGELRLGMPVTVTLEPGAEPLAEPGCPPGPKEAGGDVGVAAAAAAKDE